MGLNLCLGGATTEVFLERTQISRFQYLHRHAEASRYANKSPDCGCLTSHGITHGLEGTGALHTALTHRMRPAIDQ